MIQSNVPFPSVLVYQSPRLNWAQNSPLTSSSCNLYLFLHKRWRKLETGKQTLYSSIIFRACRSTHASTQKPQRGSDWTKNKTSMSCWLTVVWQSRLLSNTIKKKWKLRLKFSFPILNVIPNEMIVHWWVKLNWFEFYLSSKYTLLWYSWVQFYFKVQNVSNYQNYWHKIIL